MCELLMRKLVLNIQPIDIKIDRFIIYKLQHNVLFFFIFFFKVFIEH